MRLGAMSGLIYLFTVYTDESCSYYGNRSQPDKFCELTYDMS